MAQARAGRHDRLRRRRAGEFPPLVRAHAALGRGARADRALDLALRPGAGRCRFGADRQADLRRRGQRRHARDQGRRQPAGRGAGPRHRESRRPAADQRAGGPRAGRGPGTARPRRRRAVGRRRPRARPRRRGLQRHAATTLRPAAARRAATGARARAGLPLRPWLHAAAFRAERAAGLDGARTGQGAAGAPDRKPGTGLRLCYRGQQRPLALAPDAGHRPAGGGGPVARTRGGWILWIQMQKCPRA